MNEFEKLEAELKELQPAAPSEQFISRLEDALGDAGNVAMRCMPDEEESRGQPIQNHQLAHHFFSPLGSILGTGWLGLARGLGNGLLFVLFPCSCRCRRFGL